MIMMNGRKNLNNEATDIMAYLARTYFNNRCFVTHEKFKRRGFVIHHLWYLDTDAIRSNFPKGEKGRQEYIKALQPFVEKNPDRFLLIKNGIHTRIDHHRNGLSRMKKDNFTRLVVAVKMTKKTKRKGNKRSYRRHK